MTERFVPQAKNLSASLMPIGANIGIALGAGVGGVIVDQAGLRALPWMAIGFAISALAATTFSYRLDRIQAAAKQAGRLAP
ncbi:hypothetical protein D3C72_2384510 [compost metagenome]